MWTDARVLGATYYILSSILRPPSSDFRPPTSDFHALSSSEGCSVASCPRIKRDSVLHSGLGSQQGLAWLRKETRKTQRALGASSLLSRIWVLYAHCTVSDVVIDNVTVCYMLYVAAPVTVSATSQLLSGTERASESEAPMHEACVINQEVCMSASCILRFGRAHEASVCR